MDDHSNDNLPDVGSLALRSQNSGIEVMTWTNDGNVGIATTTPEQRLDVNGIVRIRSWGSGTTSDVRVNSSGHLCKDTSSKRYKKNIRELKVDPEDVLLLRSVKFDWKETEEEDIGMIAEDVAEVVPDLVVYDGDGRPEAVKYDKVALYLLELVKSQQRRILALEKEVAELKR